MIIILIESVFFINKILICYNTSKLIDKIILMLGFFSSDLIFLILQFKNKV